jgi:hypothetical protein
MRITASFLRQCLNRSSLIGSFGVVLLFFCAVSPWALDVPAVATGTVDGPNTDPTGAAVVGADVSLTDPSTGSSREVVTDDAGRYILVNAPKEGTRSRSTRPVFA